MALPTFEKAAHDGNYDFEELLIDGDLLVFSSCAAIEYGKDPSEYTLHEILQNIEGRIADFKSRVNARHVRIFFTAADNFRYVVSPRYKSNRKGAWIPASLADAKAHIMAMYHGEVAPGLEADDLLAINQKYDGSTIIATIDKDIPQVRGYHYRWETQHKPDAIFLVTGYGTLELTQHNKKSKVTGTGPRFFCYQLLIGDPTDGVMGCGELVGKIYKTGAKAGQSYTTREGVGPVEAYHLLEHAITYGRCMEIVRAQYRHRFGSAWEEMLLENGRCLYMVQKTQGNKLQLWHHDATRLQDSWYDTDTKSIVSLRG